MYSIRILNFTLQNIWPMNKIFGIQDCSDIGTAEVYSLSEKRMAINSRPEERNLKIIMQS